SGSKGVAAVRAVLDAREGAALNRRLEVKLARLLRESDLPPPVRQYEVVGGGFEAHLDFAWPAPKVALDGDGFRDHGKKSHFALAAHQLEAAPRALNWLVGATLLLSFSHQPLTLALVYGDPSQFALRRRLFTWSPLVFAAVIAVGVHVSLAAVAIVAGLWNAE